MKIQNISNGIRVNSQVKSNPKLQAQSGSSKVSFGKGGKGSSSSCSSRSRDNDSYSYESRSGKGGSSSGGGKGHSSRVSFTGMLPMNMLENMTANKADNLLNDAAKKKL